MCALLLVLLMDLFIYLFIYLLFYLIRYLQSIKRIVSKGPSLVQLKKQVG